MIWCGSGTVAALLQEIISIYPFLEPPTLSSSASNRVCNALALLKCVESHPQTRQMFLAAQLPVYVYPFMNTVSKTSPFEYLRLSSLSLIGALVKTDDPEVIAFLLQTEILPPCLRIMETGSELSKTVATFILQKILLENSGLEYICATEERFNPVSTVLSKMVNALVDAPSVWLLKHIIRCYLRLSDNPRAREALRHSLPEALSDSRIFSLLEAEPLIKTWLLQLLLKLHEGSTPSLQLSTPQM